MIFYRLAEADDGREFLCDDGEKVMLLSSPTTAGERYYTYRSFVKDMTPIDISIYKWIHPHAFKELRPYMDMSN